MPTPSKKELEAFVQTVRQHYAENRREYPWRETRNPYHILVSEFMLQQTQTDRVLPKYLNFITAFPDYKSLAHAKNAILLREWQGLGYNRRALYLKKSAEIIHTTYADSLPQTEDVLQELPGVGPYTAAAIITFAFNIPTIVIETNIRSAFLQNFFADKQEVSDQEILPLIEKTLDTQNPREWYYALMDYGTWVKKTYGNPNQRSKTYQKQSKFEGSRRQIRGRIIKNLIKKRFISEKALKKQTTDNHTLFNEALNNLEKEGIILRDTGTVTLAE